MSDDDPGPRLAAELRRFAVELHSVDADDELLAALGAEVAALRSRLTGRPRLRWYEANELGAAGRAVFASGSLFRGEHNVLAPPMVVRFDDVDGRPSAVGEVTCNRLHEGPPGSVHGGYVAGLFDDILGSTQHLAGSSFVTGVLTVRYRNLTPLDTPLRFTGWIDHARGRRLVAKATCHAGDTLTAQADALFVRLDLRPLASS